MKTAIKLSILTAAWCCAASSQVQQARRIAIYSFQDIGSSGGQQVGQRLYDRLLSKLIDSGAYQVFDRQFLERVMKEQGMPAGVFDSTTAVQLGRLANVSAIVAGTITTFTYNQHSSEDSVGYYGTVTLAATARLISTETGAMVAAPTVSQSSHGLVQMKPVPQPQRNCRNVPFRGMVCTTPDAPAAPNVETSTMEQLLDRAIEACALSLAKDVAEAGPKVSTSSYVNAPDTPPMATPATVIGVADGLTYVNKGAFAGLRIGQVLQVFRVTSLAITDPRDGRPLTRKNPVCTLTLSELGDRDSSGRCAGNPPQNGDSAEVRVQ